MHFIDLHSHVLWGIDDGAKTRDDSVEMLRLLVGMGFSEVYATPHQKQGAFVPTAEQIADRHADVCRALSDAPSATPPLLRIAAENYWDELFLTRAQTDAQPSYRLTPEVPSDRMTPVFLFELPVSQMPPRLEAQLFAFRLRGRLPVLAHPERYEALWKADERTAALARCTALVVDLGALDGAHGPERARAARHLVQSGLCHAVASDLHAPEDARGVAAGIGWIKKKLGQARLNLLLSEGPRQILDGELPDLPG